MCVKILILEISLDCVLTLSLGLNKKKLAVTFYMGTETTEFPLRFYEYMSLIIWSVSKYSRIITWVSKRVKFTHYTHVIRCFVIIFVSILTVIIIIINIMTCRFNSYLSYTHHLFLIGINSVWLMPISMPPTRGMDICLLWVSCIVR